MDTYLRMEEWGRQVNAFKDSETAHARDGYASEQLARDLLDYSRFTRFRQWTLYTQQRGEEFETLLKLLEAKGHPLDAVRRALAEEDLLSSTLALALQ
jgi:hypothetical protein